jgi:hypothetical protein
MDMTGIINIDFETHFPHKFWISPELDEETQLQYKILSSRNKETNEITFVVVRDTREAKTVIVEATMPPEIFARITGKLIFEYDINFYYYNFSHIRTPEELAAAATAVGWFSAYLKGVNFDE